VDASESHRDFHLVNMTATGGEETLSVSFKDKRYYAKKDEIKYGNTKMILAKRSEEGLVFITEQNTISNRDTYMELKSLEAGEYVIFVSIDWKNFPVEDRFFNVTSYGAGTNEFRHINQNEDGTL